MAADGLGRHVSVYCAEEGWEMKRKFYDGQRVRVIGADWTFRVGLSGFDFGSLSFRVYARGYKRQWWPEYLLELAE